MSVDPALPDEPLPLDRDDPRVQRTREELQRAVLAVLATDGVAGLTVERLVEVSHLSRATVYRHWSDPALLTLAAFEELARSGPIPEQPTGDLAADLTVYLSDLASRLSDPLYRAVLVAVLDWSARDERFAVLRARTFDENRSRASAILRAARRSGAISRRVPIGEQVEAVVAPFFYRAVVLHRTLGPRDVRRLVRRLLDDLAP